VFLIAGTGAALSEPHRPAARMWRPSPSVQSQEMATATAATNTTAPARPTPMVHTKAAASPKRFRRAGFATGGAMCIFVMRTRTFHDLDLRSKTTVRDRDG